MKVLIAEDDLMIADMIEEVLVDAGYEVCGIARTVAEAVVLGRRHRPDLAIIDMRLADNGIGTEIAAELSTLGRVGILYATGNMSKVFLTAINGDACLVQAVPRCRPPARVWKLSPTSSPPARRSRRFLTGSRCCGRQPPHPKGDGHG